MKIDVTKKAAQWFNDNVGIPENEAEAGVRFKTMIYASSPVNPGFGLAIEPNEPEEPIAEFRTDEGLLFFVEKSDAWFFDGHDLKVDYDEKNDEPIYLYIKDGKILK